MGVVSWCWGRVQSPNGVIHKTEKKLNYTLITKWFIDHRLKFMFFSHMVLP